MTICPRMIVASAQPVVSMPSNGVQPHFDAIQLFSIFFFAFRSTIVKSASKPRAMRPLPAMREDARRARARQIDKTFQAHAPGLLT